MDLPNSHPDSVVPEQPRLRTATTGDLPALRALARAALVHDTDSDVVVDLLWAQAEPSPGLRLVAELGGAPVGFALGAVYAATATAPTRGYVNLLAVAPGDQGHGHGRRLLERLEELMAGAGAVRLLIRGRGPDYAWPGIDIRYTPAVCLAESSGCTRGKEGLNLYVALEHADLATDEDERRLAADGVTVRRLRRQDEEPFRAWMLQWGGTWEGEAATALSYDPPRAHVATRNSEGADPDGAGATFVGFACHGVNRQSWFGPMGTAESERGLGVGRVLLRRCLADQRDAGLTEAEIGWTGPIHFYAEAVGATLGRVFWTYTKDVG